MIKGNFKKCFSKALILLTILFLFNERISYSQPFLEWTDLTLPGFYSPHISWGDYNNDDNLDILVFGNFSSGNLGKIFKSLNGLYFQEQTTIALPPIASILQYQNAWNDYNNDGYLDFIVIGIVSVS